MKDLIAKLKIYTDVDKDWLVFDMEIDIPASRGVEFKNKVKEIAREMNCKINVSHINDRFKDGV